MKSQNTVKRITLIAMFSAAALIIFVLESLVPPPVPIPGVKLGLANAVTLTAMYTLGKREAFYVMLIRIVIGNIFTGQAVSLIYSLAGGFACFGVMVALKGALKENQIWAVSAFGAIAHSSAQVLVAAAIMNTSSLLYYWFVLMTTSVISGVFTGICTALVVDKIKRINYINKL